MSTQYPHSGFAAVAALEAKNVDTVFGIPASHVIEIYDALRASSIRTIIGRNEQACAYSADGFARRARKPGVAAVTGGPGLGNVVTGLQTAWSDSSPLVVLTSDLPRPLRSGIRRGIPHETFDSAGLVAATGASVTFGDGSAEIYGAVEGAIEASMSWRRRPAVAVLARDALEAPWSSSGPESNGFPGALEPPGSAVTEAVALVRSAKSPVVIAGHGVLWADAEGVLAEFLRVTGIPAITTPPGVGALADVHPSWAGTMGEDRARDLLARSDLALVIGSSLGSVSTDDWNLELPTTLIHVDVDPEEFNRNYPASLAVHGDAKRFLELATSAFRETCRRVTSPAVRPRHPWVDALDAALPAGPTTVVGDVSTTLRWLVRSLRTSQDRRLLMPWNSMNMGWSYAAAIGAQAAAPEDTVVAVMGDGGALFSIGELATAIEHDLPVCLVVFNNQSYGVISELQDTLFDGNRFGVDLATPNFSMVAKGFGMPAWRVDSPQGLHDAVRAATASRSPSLVEVLIRIDDFAASAAHASPPGKK